MKLQCLISPAACEAGVGAGGGSSGFFLKPGCYQARSGQVGEGGRCGLPLPSPRGFSRVVETRELSFCVFPEGRREVGKHETQKDELENLGL